MSNTKSETEILAIIEARGRAVRAGGIDAMMADVAQDVVIYDVVDPLYREGKAASRERAVEWQASYDGPITWENRDVRVTADGDVAFSHALSHGRKAQDRRRDRHVVPHHPGLAPHRRPLADRSRPRLGIPEGFQAFWVSSPASIIHLVCKNTEAW